MNAPLIEVDRYKEISREKASPVGKIAEKAMYRLLFRLFCPERFKRTLRHPMYGLQLLIATYVSTSHLI